MKILLLMDPAIPVPPKYYGGIERVVYDLACILVNKGHTVTLVAGPGSTSPGRLLTYGTIGKWTAWANSRNLRIISSILLKEAPRHDVVHNFGRLMMLLPILRMPIAKIQTYMRYVSARNIWWTQRLGARKLVFTAVSKAIMETGKAGGGIWRTVYNCAPVHQYQFNANVDPDKGPLVFLGRLERCKGLHSAIAVAHKSKRRLIIAGNISNLEVEKGYFESEIKPLIDGELVRYIGPVDDKEKNQFLGQAAAMLLPIEWFEPFPVVLPEAFSCGTPILAFKNGGVPEGIDEGVTGFLSESVDEMARQVSQLAMINRADCRNVAEVRFSPTAIADEYLKVYREASSLDG